MSSNNKQAANGSVNGKSNKSLTNNASILSALNGKNAEVIVAALLLTGKLAFDGVTLFKDATMIVTLTGKYKTLGNNGNVDKMVKFLNENGNMTLDEVIQAFRVQTGKR